jgi:solute carrier family 25 (mitochondrial phosphate transporter), member 23/24/25/41
MVGLNFIVYESLKD